MKNVKKLNDILTFKPTNTIGYFHNQIKVGFVIKRTLQKKVHFKA